MLPLQVHAMFASAQFAGADMQLQRSADAIADWVVLGAVAAGMCLAAIQNSRRKEKKKE